MGHGILKQKGHTRAHRITCFMRHTQCYWVTIEGRYTGLLGLLARAVHFTCKGCYSNMVH